jgi:hypothetical protein
MSEQSFESLESFDEHAANPSDESSLSGDPREITEHAPRAPRPIRPRKRKARSAQPASTSEGTGEKHENPEEGDSELHQLEAQGFTPDEAARLIYISDRLANSREAQEAEAVMRRLRFHRWLVERGLLDEFSA